MAKKIINQTVDFVGDLVLGAKKKLKKQFVVTLCFHLSAVLITNTISKPTCIHVQWSVLLAKKIAEPICSDFAFSFVIRADFQET